MKKFVKCKHCGNCEFIDIDISITKFNDIDENEYLQKECFKLQKRIDKLQYKHDFETMPNWKFENMNVQISALTKIKDILEQYI